MTRRPRTSGGGRLTTLLDALRERLWFWPAAIGLLAAAAAELLVRLDRRLDEEDARPLWVFSGTADAARSVLSTIATATMTVLGVTLTITLAVLALTAQGYSPRVLRRFMRDPLVQAVIAGFVGAFVFALVALRLVRQDQVPGITVNVAVALAFVVLGLLVAFFHHLASEIRVERLVDSVWQEARSVADDRHPKPLASEAGPEPEGVTVAEARAPAAGRVRWIDLDALAEVARAAAGTVVVVATPGDFVAEGEVLARLTGGGPPETSEPARLAEAFHTGSDRTMLQDVGFGLRQLTDIALRALSPGINDPTTAEEAILRSADLLRHLSDRQLETRLTEDGRLLVVVGRPNWDELVGVAFDQLAAESEAQADAATAAVLLDAIARVVAATRDPGRLAALRARARRIRDGARRAITEPSDLKRVERAACPLT